MNSKEWLEGYAAYRIGKFRFNNPYLIGTQQNIDWRDGYLAARGRDYEV